MILIYTCHKLKNHIMPSNLKIRTSTAFKIALFQPLQLLKIVNYATFVGAEMLEWIRFDEVHVLGFFGKALQDCFHFGGDVGRVLEVGEGFYYYFVDHVREEQDAPLQARLFFKNIPDYLHAICRYLLLS